jgi:hypothetical protein
MLDLEFLIVRLLDFRLNRRLSLWFIAVAKSNPIFGKLQTIISSLIPNS